MGCTVLFTVLSGVLVFALSEWLRVIWLQPRQEFKQIQARIACALTMYAREFANPLMWEAASEFQREEYSRISEETRQLAADLSGSLQLITFLRFNIPPDQNLRQAVKHLIGLSNRLFISVDSRKNLGELNAETVAEIQKLLKLRESA